MGWYAKERAQERIARLAGQGLDLVTFWRECTDAIAPAVPHYLAPCWFTLDPASLLVTSHFQEGLPEIAAEWLAHEYLEDDVNKMADVARSERGVATLHEATGGDPRRSPRYERDIEPYGGEQEMLAGLRTASGEIWGAVGLYREKGRPMFDADDIDFMRAVARSLAEGARRGLLLGDATDPDGPNVPGLVVLRHDWSVESVTPGTERWLAELPDGDWERGDLPSSVYAVAGRAMRSAEGADEPGEIAVAYRVNSQSEAWEQALRGAGIPYAVRGAGGFYQRREVRQALTVLRAAAGRPQPVPLGLEQTTPARPPRADKAVSRVLREQMGWNGRAEPEGEAARERWRNLGALVEVAAGLADDDATTTLADVVTELSRREAEGADAPSAGGAVTLLTLHKTKGLEFSAVFLVALEEGLLPISHAKTDEAVQEERRLLYVGVTRARRQLSLSWAQRRPGYAGKVVARRPSRFLYNLGEGAPVSGSQQAATRLRTRTASPLDGAEDPALVQRLRDWRRERARADDVPAFVVFSDRTLAALAAQRPSTPRALLAVSGVGPAKVKRYGEDLIRVIAQTPT